MIGSVTDFPCCQTTPPGNNIHLTAKAEFRCKLPMELRIIVIKLDMLLKLAVFELLKEMLKIVSVFFTAKH